MTKNIKKKQSFKKLRSSPDPATDFPIGETQDLFDGIRVTWPEVELWTLRFAGISADNWRYAYYVENWNVAEKVKMAKLEGDWPPVPLRADFLL